jgi:replication initiation protein RepC
MVGLVAKARRTERSDDAALVVNGLERLKSEVEQWLRDTQEPVETHPEGLAFEPLNTSTNLNLTTEDTVTAPKKDRSATKVVLSSYPKAVVEKEFRIKPLQLLDLAPTLARYVLTETPSWTDIVNAAGAGLRPELGVSPSLWGEACRIMGREYAALALAIVSTKETAHFTSGAGGYFAGMVRKAERGELHLDRTLWALREAKWGKADKRRVH